MAQLRDQITEKQALMEELKDEHQKTSLAFEQLQRDHDKIKEEEAEKSKKLQELSLMNEHREQVGGSNINKLPEVLLVEIPSNKNNQQSAGCWRVVLKKIFSPLIF